MVPTPGRFAKLMGALGVGNDSRVVFYDQKGLASAARGWWLMGLFGHDNAAVLDGGLPKWVKEGRPVQRRRGGGAGSHGRSGRIIARGSFAAWGTCCGMCRRARTGAGCAGGWTVHRGGAGASGGDAQRAYPGFGQPALYRPAAADGTFRPAGEVRARFEAAGVDGSRPLVTSCGSGVTACILTLGLRVAGFPEGAVYDGSWTEWGGRSDTPIEVG